MKDYHSLAAWNEARSLTVAVYQATSRSARAPGLSNEIQSACVSVLSTIQHLGETGAPVSRTHAEISANKLGQLLAKAHAHGIIGTHDMNLMIRGVQSIKDSLGEIPGHRQ